MTATQHFGRMVRTHREALKLSIEKGAELCGMSYKGLEDIELGVSDPKLSSVMSIATAFGLDLGGLNSCATTVA